MMEAGLERFLTYLQAERGASPYTLRNYGNEIKEFIAFAAGRGVNQWQDVDAALIRAWMASLHDQEYHPASIARRLYELRSCFRFLVREKIVAQNPAALISPPKQPRTLPDYLSMAQMIELLSAPDVSKPLGMRDAAILETLYSAGLRRSEIMGLKVQDVNLAEKQLRVWGKGNKERIALIGEPALCNATSNMVGPNCWPATQPQPKITPRPSSSTTRVSRSPPNGPLAPSSTNM